MRRLLHLSLLALLTLPPSAADGPFRVTPDEACVVASRLTGTWVPDEALAGRLGTTARFSRLEFTEDAAVAELVPERYLEFLRGKPITLAGSLAATTTGGKKQRHPFLLVGFGGNQNIVVFRERNGDAFGDGESFILTVVPAKERANDLLFTGGDFNNEPFKAYRRAAESE
ncbi:MAG: hypothetical protein ACF8XB_14135 [Planctomycetota bacterium JB042]